MNHFGLQKQKHKGNIKGIDLKAFFGIWLSDNPVDKDLKMLLGNN
jgi:hypothetical protein